MLEWACFGLVLFSTLLYGRSKFWGAVVGMFGASSFIALGITLDMQAAIYTNIAFIAIHVRNFNIARGERNVQSNRSK